MFELVELRSRITSEAKALELSWEPVIGLDVSKGMIHSKNVPVINMEQAKDTSIPYGNVDQQVFQIVWNSKYRPIPLQDKPKLGLT
jgi:hypothetical protein